MVTVARSRLSRQIPAGQGLPGWRPAGALKKAKIRICLRIGRHYRNASWRQKSTSPSRTIFWQVPRTYAGPTNSTERQFGNASQTTTISNAPAGRHFGNPLIPLRTQAPAGRYFGNASCRQEAQPQRGATLVTQLSPQEAKSPRGALLWQRI